MASQVFKFGPNIETDFSGYKHLAQFYNFCSNYTNEVISLDFYDCRWFDANLCALLDAMLFKLNKEQNLRFSTDMDFLRQKFDVLFRNGFINDGDTVIDVQQSTLPNQNFNCNDKDNFCSYIETNLMLHRGMPCLSQEIQERIMDDLLEVFCNTHHHANTIDPFFVAGQYYPRNSTLKFTMVDLGDGFLPRINKATFGDVTTHLAAINWAIEGNSSKLRLENTPGNLGIRGMLKYCSENQGILQIISGNGFWSSDFSNTFLSYGREIPQPFVGTTINLFFRKK